MPSDPSPALRVTDLRFRYAAERADSPWTVDVHALELAHAEQLLLTGGSGRGKSTLLLLIAGLLDPTEGAVEVAAQRVHALRGTPRDLFRGRRIGMIFQTFNLLHGFSALENVMAALMFSTIPPREHRSRAEALLKRLDIRDTHSDPDRLSVGQQQRVAVARALACDPALVLADEPTASLDPDNAAGAMDLIQQLCAEKGAALLCVSHDPAMTARFPRRTALDSLAARPAVAH
ncbi:MAG TPA: ABC transporter ATP-binding protein [Phycisphaerales bacterium]|nr:ABC transporter ATP-binding protein [Phycisphaerales bacterium]